MNAQEALKADTFSVLVTGANSGLGYAICCRLIDEFLQTRPQSQSLNLIITTRDRRKSDDTVARLRQHLQRACRSAEKSVPGRTSVLLSRVGFQQELLDLTSILSVQRLARKLLDDGQRTDALILNAGIGGWIGVNWGNAIYTILTDWVHAVTWPTLKISAVGWVTKPQISNRVSAPNGHVEASGKEARTADEPPLGEIFCANLFGHYLLAHYLVPLLSTRPEGSDKRGRIIWVSSLEAYAHTLDFNDFQSLASPLAYESSKRITDVLVLTSELPSTAPWVKRYLTLDFPYSVGRNTDVNGTAETDAAPQSTPPKLYLSHPGICSTGIFPLPYVLGLLMTLAFYIARWLGSMWHTVTPYSGACAPVWLTLTSQEMLDRLEKTEGKVKWGSATDWWGRERVARTEVEGWGWSGVVGEVVKRKGRMRGAKELTKEDREGFEEVGRRCWGAMEGLREEWEGRLKVVSGDV